MIKRYLENKIRSALVTNSSVALMGLRQVGKTTLAINIVDTILSVYLDLKNRIYFQKTQDNKQPRGKTTGNRKLNCDVYLHKNITVF